MNVLPLLGGRFDLVQQILPYFGVWKISKNSLILLQS